MIIAQTESWLITIYVTDLYLCSALSYAAYPLYQELLYTILCAVHCLQVTGQWVWCALALGACIYRCALNHRSLGHTQANLGMTLASLDFYRFRRSNTRACVNYTLYRTIWRSTRFGNRKTQTPRRASSMVWPVRAICSIGSNEPDRWWDNAFFIANLYTIGCSWETIKRL